VGVALAGASGSGDGLWKEYLIHRLRLLQYLIDPLLPESGAWNRLPARWPPRSAPATTDLETGPRRVLRWRLRRCAQDRPCSLSSHCAVEYCLSLTGSVGQTFLSACPSRQTFLSACPSRQPGMSAPRTWFRAASRPTQQRQGALCAFCARGNRARRAERRTQSRAGTSATDARSGHPAPPSLRAAEQARSAAARPIHPTTAGGRPSSPGFNDDVPPQQAAVLWE
jgi:hypothetical protein